MKRYSLWVDLNRNPATEDSASGAWVRYEDAHAEIEELSAQTGALRLIRDSMQAEIDRLEDVVEEHERRNEDMAYERRTRE